MFIQRSRLIGLIVLFFLVGAVTGTVYESVASAPDTQRKRRARMSDMVATLDLSADQKARLDKVLDEGRKCMVGLNKTYRSEFAKVRDTTQVQIQAILTAEQRVEFNQMMAEREKRRKAHHGPRNRSGSAE